MSKSNVLFPAGFLEPYLSEFKLSAIPNLHQIKQIIANWNAALSASKLDKLKEEEIKSRFLLDFFGEILGFNYRNNGKWLFREEAKTMKDGTKADGALGLFYVSGNTIINEIQIVIEVKDVNTALEKPQNRKDFKVSPIDQAFLYATKMGGHCQWVVVTNLVEIRFYHYSSQNEYQRYTLTELAKEEVLKEFLFLFHRNRFYNGKTSSTLKLFSLVKRNNKIRVASTHIIDKLYFKLKKFEDLPFLNPNFLANDRPFNILEENVWHYQDFNLFTLNPEIHDLLLPLRVDNGAVIINPAYRETLEGFPVVEYENKLSYIFRKLKNSQINKISAINNLEALKQKNKDTIGFTYRTPVPVNESNGTVLDLKYPTDEDCECIRCSIRSLDFKKLLHDLEEKDGKVELEDLDYAYAHYLLATNNYKKCYKLYSNIITSTVGDDQKLIDYFIAKYNLRNAGHLLIKAPENTELKKHARSIDLDRVLSEEIEIFADEDLRKALVEIKENKVFSSALDKSKELLYEIKQLKGLYDQGGSLMAGPDYLNQLVQNFVHAFAYIQKNRIIQDVYLPYATLVENMFEGLISYVSVRELGVRNFNEFYVIEAILYLQPKKLKELLEYIDKIPLDEKAKKTLLTKFLAFFKSYYRDGFFGATIREDILEKQLLNHAFRDKFTNIFNNICLVLAKLELSPEVFQPLSDAIVHFIQIDQVMAHWDIKSLAKLIETSGDLFPEKDLIELLNISVDRHRHATNIKYKDLIVSIPKCIKKFHPGFSIDNGKLIRTAIINCYSDETRADLRPLSGLWHISTVKCQLLLTTAFEEYLDMEFNEHLYDHLLKNRILSFDRKDYLLKLALKVNKNKRNGYTGTRDGKIQFDDVYCYNFLLIPYILNLSFDLPEMNSLDKLSEFECWMQNPEKFDYDHFEVDWLKVTNNEYILDRLKGNQKISESLTKGLKVNFDEELAKILFKYFV